MDLSSMFHLWYASKKYLGVSRLNFTNLSKFSIWFLCYCPFRSNVYVLLGGLHYNISTDTFAIILIVASMISTYSLYSCSSFFSLFSFCCSFLFSTFNLWLHSTFCIVIIQKFSFIGWSYFSSSWEASSFCFHFLSSAILFHLMT